MQLLKAREKDVSFIYDCLKLLRGEVVYSEAELRNYLINNSYFEFENMGSEIWIGWNNGTPTGMLSTNKFNIPRYLGEGIELEEVIVSKEAQGQGYGLAMIESFLARVAADPLIRRVIVKTDDTKIASGLYGKIFSETQYITFVKRLNNL